MLVPVVFPGLWNKFQKKLLKCEHNMYLSYKSEVKKKELLRR